MSSSAWGRILGLFLAVVVSLTGAGCGGGGGDDGGNRGDTSEQDSGTDDGGGDGGQDDGGDDGGGGGPGVAVSPLKIPAIEQKGAPIGDVRDSIAAEFADACGGELCVDLAEAASDGGAVNDECAFSRTNPAEGTEVERGSTVTLVVRCERGGSGGGEEEEEEEEQDTTTTEDSGDGGS